MNGKILKIVFIIVLFLLCGAFSVTNSIADLDLWHRLAAGEYFFEHGYVAQKDIFAFTPVKDKWIDHEWLAGVIFYSLAVKYGEFSLYLIKFLFLFLTCLLIYSTLGTAMELKKRKRLLFFFLVVWGMQFSFSVTVRSHIFTYFFFALWLWALELLKRGKLILIPLFPLTMIIWANAHGGYLSGIGLLVMYAAGEFLNKKPFRIYIVLILVSLAATLINPYGLEYWRYIIDAVVMPRPQITEWRSFNIFKDPLVFPAQTILFFIVLYGFFKRKIILKKNIDKTGLIVSAVTFYLALRHVRHLTFFTIAAGVFGFKCFFSGPAFINFKFLSDFLKKPFFYFFTAGIICLGFILILLPHTLTVSESRYPVGAVEFIAANEINGNLAVHFNHGSYILWKLYPLCRVAMDGRYETAYPEDVFRDNIDFYKKIGTQREFLKKYPVDLILVNKNTRLYDNLKEISGWEIIYEDDNFCLLAEKEIYINAAYTPPKENILNKKIMNSVRKIY